MIVRRLPLALAVLALVTTTACEKPAPQITIASSGRVINVDASQYCFGTCLVHAVATKSIRVRGNTTVSFDVPKRVARKGWILVFAGQPQFAQPRNESHYTLSIPSIAQSQPLDVSIIETGTGDPAKPTGEWKMQFLVRE
ncbi:MAG: DUF2771 family protein [Actinomycetota bacterium]